MNRDPYMINFVQGFTYIDPRDDYYLYFKKL